jgi:hypothetical protein
MMEALSSLRHLLFLQLHFWIPHSQFCSKVMHVFWSNQIIHMKLGIQCLVLRLFLQSCVSTLNLGLVYIVTWKPEEAAIARIWHSKHMMTLVNREPLLHNGWQTLVFPMQSTPFFMWSVLRLYNKDSWEESVMSWESTVADQLYDGRELATT